jgi:hypothetical protein
MDVTDGDNSALRPEVPHAARIWNYWMGGTDNFAADRAAGDAVAQVYPEIVLMAKPGADSGRGGEDARFQPAGRRDVHGGSGL